MVGSCHGGKQWWWWLTEREAGRMWQGSERSGNGVNMEKGRTLTASLAPVQGPSDAGARFCETKSNRGHKINTVLPQHPPKQTANTAKTKTARINIYKIFAQSHVKDNPDKCKRHTKGYRNTHTHIHTASILPKKWNAFLLVTPIGSTDIAEKLGEKM